MKHNLPEVFEWRLQNGDHDDELFEFFYSEEDEAFIIGGQKINPQDFNPFEYSPVSGEAKGVRYSEVSESYVLMPNFGALVICPKLVRYAQENIDWPTEVLRVMRDCYKMIDPSAVNDPRFYDQGSGYLGFRAGLDDDQLPSFQVMGNCACMSAFPNAALISGRSEAGFSQYDLHNIDLQAEGASIYAGIGHLAFLASGKSTRLKLF